MHIAICDDNVADRKQTERLMGREADKWIAAKDPLYIFSFGSIESLLANTMHFDAILLDVLNDSNTDLLDLLNALNGRGADGTLVWLGEKTRVENVSGDENILFLNKPIVPKELHELMVKIKEISLSHVSRIELRGTKETLYVNEDDIMYATQEGEYTDVALVGGRSFTIQGRTDILYEEIKDKHQNYIMPANGTLINLKYVSELGFCKVIMSGGRHLRVSMSAIKEIKALINR